MPSDAGLSLEHRKKVWATVLAIKLFETQLAGERSVWQLVVDKGRAWMKGLTGVGAEDITQDGGRNTGCLKGVVPSTQAHRDK